MPGVGPKAYWSAWIDVVRWAMHIYHLIFVFVATTVAAAAVSRHSSKENPHTHTSHTIAFDVVLFLNQKLNSKKIIVEKTLFDSICLFFLCVRRHCHSIGALAHSHKWNNIIKIEEAVARFISAFFCFIYLFFAATVAAVLDRPFFSYLFLHFHSLSLSMLCAVLLWSHRSTIWCVSWCECVRMKEILRD